MKKKLNSALVLIAILTGSMLFTSCNNYTPEKTFEIAVLNSNLLSSFGSTQINRQLESEPQVYDDATKKMIPSSYYDYFQFQITELEKRYKTIAEIKEDDDNRELLAASKDLFSYAIAKQKEGYLPIAKMKDEKVPADQIQTAIADFDASTDKDINTKFTALMNVAKAYIKKHNINAKVGN
ncbi:hypothetical protein [Flavobacterium sp.]|uniref:hypothetical protein n=1 Tax=Flavobacterium sp. TaxID=239 RepID=UPI003D151963